MFLSDDVERLFRDDVDEVTSDDEQESFMQQSFELLLHPVTSESTSISNGIIVVGVMQWLRSRSLVHERTR